MRKSIQFIILLSIFQMPFAHLKAQCLLDSVIINALLVDPSGTDFNFDTNGDELINSNDEFVELCNTSSVTIDLSNWVIGDDDPPPFPDFQIPDSTNLLPGACILIVANYCPELTVDLCETPDGVLNMGYQFSGFLGNAGDVISIIDTLGNSCSVVYGSTVCSQVDLLDIPDFDPNFCDDWGGDIDGCPLLAVGDSCDYEPVVLNIEFINAFISILNDEQVLIEWSVIENKPNIKYQIEWTEDLNKSFQNIVEKRSETVLNKTHTYRVVHESPNPGLNYYRINQIDPSGALTQSNVLVAKLSEDTFVNIFPTLFSEGIYISGDESFYDLSLWDASGKMIINSKRVFNEHFVDLTYIQSGTYFVRMANQSHQKIFQIFKI